MYIIEWEFPQVHLVYFKGIIFHVIKLTLRIGNSETDIGYCLSDYPWLWNIGMKISYEGNLIDFPPKYLGIYIWINNIKVNVDTFNTLINISTCRVTVILMASNYGS